MIQFKNFNNFDAYFLNDFVGMEPTEANKLKLREKIEDLYINDNDVHYDTKGETYSIWNTFENSMLEIIFE
jgi:hypothetical protein